MWEAGARRQLLQPWGGAERLLAARPGCAVWLPLPNFKTRGVSAKESPLWNQQENPNLSALCHVLRKIPSRAPVLTSSVPDTLSVRLCRRDPGCVGPLRRTCHRSRGGSSSSVSVSLPTGKQLFLRLLVLEQFVQPIIPVSDVLFHKAFFIHSCDG